MDWYDTLPAKIKKFYRFRNGFGIDDLDHSKRIYDITEGSSGAAGRWAFSSAWSADGRTRKMPHHNIFLETSKPSPESGHQMTP